METSSKDYGLKDAAGKEIKPNVLFGVLKTGENRETFRTLDNGVTLFTTYGGISPGPGSTHDKDYEVDWVLTADNKLYATEIRWDIRYAFDEQYNVIQKSRVIKLDH